mgnify:CR=1 FL=1
MSAGEYSAEVILDKDVECLDLPRTLSATQVRFNEVKGGRSPGTIYSIEQDGELVVFDEEVIEALYQHMKARQGE